MQVYNALQLKAGAKVQPYTTSGTLTQPVQFLPYAKKDDEWRAWNMDWLEMQGLKQIKKNAKRLLKNYKLAKGIIDKTDYMVCEDNEHADLIETLTKEDESALELKFYPIIPNVINVLKGEFAKRQSKIMFRAVDDTSHNEMEEQKRAEIETVLLQRAQQKMMMTLMEQGYEPDSEEFEQAMSPENLKTLPEIEEFFKKDYRSLVEEWATHQKNVDEERFRMYELEVTGFGDSLIADREFWHFKMNEDDYEVELWNPVLTFYHKSPETKYISEGNYVGKIEMMSVADVIDKYGYMMTAKQLESLAEFHPAHNAKMNFEGMQNDGTYWNKKQGSNMPSVAMRQLQNMESFVNHGDDVLNWIMSEGTDDVFDFSNRELVRVSTVYWKSQRKLYWLTSILPDGSKETDVVDESYEVTEKPIYNTTLFKEKSPDNLIWGEHLEAIWINDTWGGVKIGPNQNFTYSQDNNNGVNPIYLGINAEKPSRLPYQFKGDYSLYGCKLPVEGAIFSERNTKSVGLVELMKPYQIGHNMCNNQIADILVDELGTVIALDQNALPRHSMGEDWGKHNMAKAYVAMKNFQILPFDTTITNTENAVNFQHYQVLNMEQTQRLMSRVNLANHFKQQAFEVIGITPQRMGDVSSSESATGVEAAVQNSFAQTEMYFVQHSDFLMPRVHQMRTDLAQYYHSNKPSVRLQYVTSLDEKVNFQMNGTKLLSREFNVYCTTRTNHRAVLEKLKSLALSNNTAGASIFDLGNIIQSNSIAEVVKITKAAEEKAQMEQQKQREHEQQLEQQRLEAAAQEEQAQREYEAVEAQKEREKDILVAEIRGAGMAGAVDLNANAQSDFLDGLGMIQKQQQYQDTMNQKRESETNKVNLARETNQLKREEIQLKDKVSQRQLQIARENKNKYDQKQKSQSKKKK
jgi:hypothetical protein